MKDKRIQDLKEKGITLIALVVTIIILLILAGVTLNMALSGGGLFSRARNAADKYKKAQEDEKDLISEIGKEMNSEYVGAKVTGYTLTKKEVKIKGTASGVGNSNNDTVIGSGTIPGVEVDGNQTFTTETEMNWRVWDYDGNILRIIGEPTNSKLTLQGATGYNNGVWIMDNICKTLYSNGNPKVTATNLKRSDIQKVSTYDYTKYKYKPEDSSEIEGDDLINFGEAKMYSSYNKYPDIWGENDKKWKYEYKDGITIGEDKECVIWEEFGKGEGEVIASMKDGNEEMKFKQSYYQHDYNKNEFINDTYYDLIFMKDEEKDNNNYWLASRCVRLLNDYCLFSFASVVVRDNMSSLNGFRMQNSKDYDTWQRAYLRPIVSIDLKESGCTMKTVIDGDGKVQACNLSWN